MVERGQDARLALEARQAIGMRRERGRQELDGHVAPETGVARAIDFAHAACADPLVYAVDAKPPARQRDCLTPVDDAHCNGWSREEPLGGDGCVEQRLHFQAHGLVAGTRLFQKRCALRRRTRQRLVIQPFDLLPADRIHRGRRHSAACLVAA